MSGPAPGGQAVVAPNAWPAPARGFTLLEVLVALAVLSVALFAVVMVAAQRAETLHELQKRQLALQVADGVLNEYLHHQSTASSLPGRDDWQTGVQLNGSYRWYWRIRRQSTPNTRIFRIEAEVAEDPTFQYLSAHLTGFSPP